MAAAAASAAADHHLSEIDELCIENAARYCLENDLAATTSNECDLEEYEALVGTLQQQRDYHLHHTHILNNLLRKLPDVNVGPIQQKHLSEDDEKFVEDAAAYLLEHSSDAPSITTKQEMESLVVTLQQQDQFHLQHLETINDLLSRLGGSGSNGNSDSGSHNNVNGIGLNLTA